MNFKIYEIDPGFSDAMEDKLFRRQYEKSHSMEIIAQRFRELRRKKGITQIELARQINTTQSAVSRFENASRGATLDLASRMAQALGVGISIS